MSESDGIWILKKDSQRRQTLNKVLTEDEKKICDIWMEKIEHDRSEKTILEIVRKYSFNVELMVKLIYFLVSSRNAH